MPHVLQASDAPTGLSVRLDRVAHRGMHLRVWRMTLDGSAAVVGDQRHDIVLVHGLGVSSQYFERLAVRLAAVGVVHLLDLPGFAGVPQPAGQPQIADFAALVAWWMRREGLSAPVLVGHSMGAQIVTEVLATEPDLATHGVLIGPPVNVAERSATRQALRLAQSSVRESSRTRRIALSGYVQCGPHWFSQVLPRMLTYPIEERLTKVTAPVLLVRGEHDTVAPTVWLDRLAAAAPSARTAQVDGAAHAVIYDHSDEVATLVLDHLQRRDVAPA
ncbi:alpha/beta fold hydrolase [Cellulomonas soli]